MQRNLQWSYVLLLISLIILGWLFVRSGSVMFYPGLDGESNCVVCYSDCRAQFWPFEAGKYIFSALLLLRLAKWKKQVRPVELIAGLLCWAYLFFETLQLGVASIRMTIRMGNLTLLGWILCLLPIGPVLITLAQLSAMVEKQTPREKILSLEDD